MKRLWVIILFIYIGCDSIKKDQFGPYYGGPIEREVVGTIVTSELWVCLKGSNGNYFLDLSCGGTRAYLLTKERKNVYYLMRKDKKENLTITNSKSSYSFVYKGRTYYKKSWDNYNNRPESTFRPALYY